METNNEAASSFDIRLTVRKKVLSERDGNLVTNDTDAVATRPKEGSL